MSRSPLPVLACSACLVLLLAGCGNRGPLVLPDAPAEAPPSLVPSIPAPDAANTGTPAEEERPPAATRKDVPRP